MTYQFHCPTGDCDFSCSGSEQAALVEDARQHMSADHEELPTRAKVEQYMIGPE